MKIGLGADHAGYELKNEIAKHLESKGISVVDYGAHSLESVDYPDFGKKVGQHVVNNDVDLGIVVCGTGIGISIAANKVKGVRAALVYDELTAQLAKEHNHANVIALGARTTETSKAMKIVDAFLNAKEEERHNRRIEKISKIEQE